MAHRRKSPRGGRRGPATSSKRRAGSGRSRKDHLDEATVRAMLGRTFVCYGRALPRVAAVMLVGAVPSQLVLAWLLERYGVTSPFWEMQYQGLVDWIIGSLIVGAIYPTIFEATSGDDGRGLIGAVGWAYARGLRSWAGMFVTRTMVSFVFGIAALPVLAGVWGVGRLWPDLGQTLTDPERILEASAADIAPLLLVVPLVAIPVGVLLRYVLVEAVVSLERIDGLAAMQRSASLTKGARWRILLCLLAVGLPPQAAMYVVVGASSEVGAVASALLSSAVMVFGALRATAYVVIYEVQGGEAPALRVAPGKTEPEP